MMKKCYEFAGIQVEVSVPDGWRSGDERSLKEFCIERAEDPHLFQYEMAEELPQPEGKLIARTPFYRVYDGRDGRNIYMGTVGQDWKNAYMCANHNGKDHRVKIKADRTITSVTSRIILNTLNLEHLMLEVDGFILHASYISRNGKGILFTAPSGTGKSTQAELWRKYRNAQIINGDRAVVRIAADGVLACGLPYAGSSEYCINKTLPLNAIVYLEQGKRTTIHPLQGIHAFRKLWEQITVPLWDKRAVEKISNILQAVMKEIPVYHLSCTPDESAVTVLETELDKR